MTQEELDKIIEQHQHCINKAERWTVEVIKHFFSFLPWAKKEDA